MIEEQQDWSQQYSQVRCSRQNGWVIGSTMKKKSLWDASSIRVSQYMQWPGEQGLGQSYFAFQPLWPTQHSGLPSWGSTHRCRSRSRSSQCSWPFQFSKRNPCKLILDHCAFCLVTTSPVRFPPPKWRLTTKLITSWSAAPVPCTIIFDT